MTDEEQPDDETQERRLSPISLHPLRPEEAVHGFMQVDPEKVKERLESEGDESGQEG